MKMKNENKYERKQTSSDRNNTANTEKMRNDANET